MVCEIGEIISEVKKVGGDEKWISVGEKLPEEFEFEEGRPVASTFVLAYVTFDNIETKKSSGIIMKARTINGKWTWEDEDDSFVEEPYRVSHWAELPPPPQK